MCVFVCGCPCCCAVVSRQPDIASTRAATTRQAGSVLSVSEHQHSTRKVLAPHVAFPVGSHVALPVWVWVRLSVLRHPSTDSALRLLHDVVQSARPAIAPICLQHITLVLDCGYSFGCLCAPLGEANEHSVDQEKTRLPAVCMWPLFLCCRTQRCKQAHTTGAASYG